ncbi:MAG: hypothetical protein ABSC89_07370 [Verrucomicrobiota bacterium]|jgi:hypothetical protein
MKKPLAILFCLLAFVLGSAVGYFVGHWKGHRTATELVQYEVMEREQKNLEFETRAYFRCLQDLDSGSITNLHAFALGHLRFYVDDVQQLQREGYTFAPHIPSLYSNAMIYVAAHPR